MTKIELARLTAKDLDIDLPQARVFVQKILDTVLDVVASEGRLELRNFGVFEVCHRGARKARNPRTGAKVFVPERYVVSFKPGKVMQERIARSGGRRR